MPASLPATISAPASYSRLMLATMQRYPGPDDRRRHQPGTGTIPRVEPDYRPPVRDQLDQFGGRVHAVLGPERHVLESVGPGRHRVRDRLATACACAVTWSPCRCASSTAARSISAVNWGRC